MQTIKEKLENLRDGDLYPFHMPGHKRNPDSGDMSKYMDIDITEIDDFDNLHDAEGMILDAEKKASKLYHSEETHFLVNGSTSGILAAVSSSVSDGGTILTGRNSHKALYHAAYIRRLKVKYLSPKKLELENGGILWGKYDPEEVEDALSEDENIEAVFITSPTYEGISSDVAKIADICHEKKKILIVDAAHGAHFGLHKELPENAIAQGADIVIHSVHKTLASMTQTALIHVQGDLVKRDRLRRFLRIYQSSSPSYVLMASIDSSINDLLKRSDEIFTKLIRYRKKIENETKGLKNLFIPGYTKETDPCKVLVCARCDAITGQQIYDILRLEYRLQPEMAGDFYALLIMTSYDTEDGINRLIKAVIEIDRRISKGDFERTPEKKSLSSEKCMRYQNQSDDFVFPEAIYPLYIAWDAEHEEIEISKAEGRVSGEFINLYPPGIPIIAPGELFTKEIIQEIEIYINDKRNIQGINMTEDKKRKVKVIYGKNI